MTDIVIDVNRQYTKYTIKDLEKVLRADWGSRLELLEGRLVEKPVPKFEHSYIERKIMREFDKFDPNEEMGQILAEVTVYVSATYSPIPDLCYWVAARTPARKVVIAPIPDLAIEVQTPEQSVPGLIEKARHYLQAGCKLVWIIQPAKQNALILRQGRDTIDTVPPEGDLAGEDVIPGFKLPLKVLFEEN